MNRIITILWLRYKILCNGLRRGIGVADLISTCLLVVIGAAMSLGLAFAFGLMVHKTALKGEVQSLRVSYYLIFFIVSLLWFTFMVLHGARSRGFDHSHFLRFPMTGGALFRIVLTSSAANPVHLVFYPSLIAVLIAAIAYSGVCAPASSLLILLFACCFVTWNQAIALILQALMRNKNIWELMTIVFFLGWVSTGLALHQFGTRADQTGDLDHDVSALLTKVRPNVNPARALPPSLAAEGLCALYAQDSRRVSLCTLALAAWGAAGLALGYGVFRAYHLQNRGRGGKRTSKRARPDTKRSARAFSWFSVDSVSFLPQDVTAMASKEVRYLFRSSEGKINLFMIPILVLFFSSLVSAKLEQPVFGFEPQKLVLLGTLVFAVHFSGNFLNNAFAWDGPGVAVYYFSPAPLLAVIVGKNLGVWIYNVIIVILALATWISRAGWPGAETLTTGLLVCAAAILGSTIIGNAVSIYFPKRRDIASVMSSPSQTGALCSFASLIINTSIIFLFAGMPVLLGAPHLRPVFLAVLVGADLALYAAAVKHTSRLMVQRGEQLIESMAVQG